MIKTFHTNAGIKINQNFQSLLDYIETHDSKYTAFDSGFKRLFNLQVSYIEDLFNVIAPATAGDIAETSSFIVRYKKQNFFFILHRLDSSHFGRIFFRAFSLSDKDLETSAITDSIINKLAWASSLKDIPNLLFSVEYSPNSIGDTLVTVGSEQTIIEALDSLFLGAIIASKRQASSKATEQSSQFIDVICKAVDLPWLKNHFLHYDYRTKAVVSIINHDLSESQLKTLIPVCKALLLTTSLLPDSVVNPNALEFITYISSMDIPTFQFPLPGQD